MEAVTTWHQPRSVRGLLGFLGLAGYYRRFIQSYAAIASPLTQLLKRDGFVWTQAAFVVFAALKHALSTALVLQLPNFDQPFLIDCGASRSGFGAVLHQGEGAIAFFS